jgi:hypothetical protein
VSVLGAFYSVANGEESIESLNEGSMPVEEMRYTFNNPRSVDAWFFLEKIQQDEPLILTSGF